MIEAEELELLRQGFQRALEADDAGKADEALAELGWREALVAEGQTVVPLIFTEKGLANAAATVLDDLLLSALGLTALTGAGVVLPEVGARTPPGSVVGGRLSVRGSGTARLLSGGAVVVAAAADGACQAVSVRVDDLTVHPVAGIDPAFGLVAVAADGAAFKALDEAAITWQRVIATAQLALAFELLGASRAMLGLAREHALARTQFGRPIASFQAVRHRLADSLLAVEGLAAAVSAAWDAFGSWPSGGPDRDQLAAIAKAVAGRNARSVARNCQQVLAGIGFTAEHRFHRYFRRVLLLDEMLGSARELTRELGGDLLAARELPVTIPL
jgi:hypothetical protein